MQFNLLNNSDWVTDDEREFVKQTDSGNHPHQQRIASEIYSSATLRKASEDIILASKRIAEAGEENARKMLKWTRWMAIATIAMCLAAFMQVRAAFRTVDLQNFANSLNSILTENSNRELEAEKKKLSFDIVNTLYKDFYQFSDANSEVIRKLDNNIQIDKMENLAVYLNGFEDLYEQCKRGLITRQDILMNFQYLIGPTCNNTQVESVIGNHGNGLKLLCKSFYPDSRLGKKGKPEGGSCN